MDDKNKEKEMQRLLDEPLSNLIHSVYDAFVVINATHQNKMGVKQVVVRRELANCCAWCKSLAGTYDYSGGDYPEDIFRRHDNCKCMVTVRAKGGKWQDAWSKKEFNTEKEARKARLKEIENETKIVKTKNKQALVQKEKRGISPYNPYGEKVENVFGEYMEKAKPENGKIHYQKGYKISKNIEESSCAEWIKQRFGGRIVVIKNSNKVKLPDFGWNNKLWELKTPNTVEGTDKLIHKGIHQIEKKPGGIILDVKNLNEEEQEEAIDVAINRIRRSSKHNIDLIIKKENKLIRILRIKK